MSTVAPMNRRPLAVTIGAGRRSEDPGDRHALGGQILVLAQRNAPHDITRIRVHGEQFTPRRSAARIALGVFERYLLLRKESSFPTTPSAAILRPCRRCAVLPKIMPVVGSNAGLPQLPPPSELGKTRLGTIRYGVSGPAWTTLSYCALQVFSDSGEVLFTSSRVMLTRATGGGFNGTGCVGQAVSPGASVGNAAALPLRRVPRR